MVKHTQKSTEPKKRYFKSNRYLDLDYCTLDGALKELNELVELGVDPQSTIQLEEEYDSWSLNLYEFREETENERNIRLATEERVRQSREEYQRKQYEQLKKKFGE